MIAIIPVLSGYNQTFLDVYLIDKFNKDIHCFLRVY